MLSFSLGDFNLMSKEFPSYYEQLQELAILRMKMILKVKLKAIKLATMQQIKFDK